MNKSLFDRKLGSYQPISKKLTSDRYNRAVLFDSP